MNLYEQMCIVINAVVWVVGVLLVFKFLIFKFFF